MVLLPFSSSFPRCTASLISAHFALSTYDQSICHQTFQFFSLRSFISGFFVEDVIIIISTSVIVPSPSPFLRTTFLVSPGRNDDELRRALEKKSKKIYYIDGMKKKKQIGKTCFRSSTVQSFLHGMKNIGYKKNILYTTVMKLVYSFQGANEIPMRIFIKYM